MSKPLINLPLVQYYKKINSYIVRAGSLLESHYNNTYCLDDVQKELVIELYANSVVVRRYLNSITDDNREQLSKIVLSNEESIALSQMIRMIVQVLLELNAAGIRIVIN